MHSRILSIFFSAVLLLSSGAVQLGVHLCSKTGPSFFSSCSAEHDETPTCCKKNKKTPQDSDCCKETYWFAITPKFGSVEKIKLSGPENFDVVIYSITELLPLSYSYNGIEHREHSPPGHFKHSIQSQYCIWTI
jgi:hypothetical protein